MDERGNAPGASDGVGKHTSGAISFDPVAHIYDDTRGYPPATTAAIAEAMMRHGPIAPGARALEIGVGTGRIALPLLERGVNVTGVDISERMVERLRAKYAAARAERPEAPWGALEAPLGDIAALPFGDGVFDAAIAVHVLHLTPTWRQALDEVFRTLKPGAPFLLGQDMTHGSPLAHPLQDEWVEIMRGLGVAPRRVGAKGHAEILAELARRGLTIEEWTVAEWTTTHTPEEAFGYVAERVWSLTWQAPESAFTESIRRLELWARGRYGDRWREPFETAYSFRLARITQPAK